MVAVLRAIFGYCFLVFMVRVAGRSPGKQRTPADFIVVFFMGGLTLTAMVGNDRSITNGITIVISIALTHYAIAWLKQRYATVGRIVDGTPMVLFENGAWNTEVMKETSIQETDVIAALRDKGLRKLGDIRYAILERNGEISIISQDSAS